MRSILWAVTRTPDAGSGQESLVVTCPHAGAYVSVDPHDIANGWQKLAQAISVLCNCIDARAAHAYLSRNPMSYTNQEEN